MFIIFKYKSNQYAFYRAIAIVNWPQNAMENGQPAGPDINREPANARLHMMKKFLNVNDRVSQGINSDTLATNSFWINIVEVIVLLLRGDSVDPGMENLVILNRKNRREHFHNGLCMVCECIDGSCWSNVGGVSISSLFSASSNTEIILFFFKSHLSMLWDEHFPLRDHHVPGRTELLSQCC